MAAVKIAQAMGAEVFATASSSKWEFLKSLGIKHIMILFSILYRENLSQKVYQYLKKMDVL